MSEVVLYGLGFQVKSLKYLKVFPLRLEGEGRGEDQRRLGESLEPRRRRQLITARQLIHFVRERRNFRRGVNFCVRGCSRGRGGRLGRQEACGVVLVVALNRGESVKGSTGYEIEGLVTCCKGRGFR